MANDKAGKKKKKRRVQFGPFSCVIDLSDEDEGDEGDEGDEDETTVDLTALLLSGLPRDVRKHLKSARLELLRAVRAMIDARIESVERSASAGEKRVEKVPLDDDESEA